MFQINVHAFPKEDSGNFGKGIGAYVTLYINYADIDGAYELARFYVTDNGWEIKELEEEYFIIKSESEIDEDQLQFYREAMHDGYSLIFHCYESDDGEE